jgi:hypothetical protein
MIMNGDHAGLTAYPGAVVCCGTRLSWAALGVEANRPPLGPIALTPQPIGPEALAATPVAGVSAFSVIA